MRTWHGDARIWMARVGALIAVLALTVAGAAPPAGTGPSGDKAGSGTQTRAQIEAQAREQTREGVGAGDQVQARTESRIEARSEVQERNRVGGTEVPAAPEPVRERARELTGSCPSLGVFLGVYLGESGTPLWQRWHERLAGASCHDAEAMLLAAQASEPAGDLDRLRDRLDDPELTRDRLQDGSCQLLDPYACPELQEHDYDFGHDYDHDYDHEYLSPGPHGGAGPD